MVGLVPDFKELSDGLRLLDGVLVERAPSIRDALRPGLAEAEVHTLLEGYPHEVPEEMALLYSWHDGASIVDGPERAELFPNAQMLPLGDALGKWNEVVEASRASGRALWDPRWFPMFVGYKWAFWAVRCGPLDGSVIVFDWVDLPDVWAAYDDVSSMIERVVRCWSAGAYRQGPNATVEEDLHKVAQINRELDRKPPDIDQLIADLASGDDHLFSQAIAQVRTRLYPEAVPGLIRMLDMQSRGRMAAVELLGEIGGPEAIASLRRAADADPDDFIRQSARHTLASASTSGPI